MAQSIAGTDLSVTAIATDRKVAYKVEVQWDGTNWTDESARVLSLSGRMSLVPGGSSRSASSGGVSNFLTVTLRNAGNRFSPNNTSSAIYDYIKDGGIHMMPIRASMGFYSGATPETIRIFTGVIDTPREGTISKTVIWECQDIAAIYNEEKVSTVVSKDVRSDSFIAILCNLIGITAGDRSLDRGISAIPFAWTDEENALQQVALTAAADGGMVYMAEDGKLIFENAFHWAVVGTDHTTSQFTFSVGNFQELEPEFAPRDVYYGVIVEVSPYEEGGISLIYARDDVIVLPPGETKDLVARLRLPSTNVSDPTAEEDYIAITAGGRRIKTGGATPVYLSDDVTITGTKYGQRVDLELANASSYTLYLIKFQLRGIPLFGAPSDEIRMETAAGYAPDERVFELRGNQFIQTWSQGDFLAQIFRDRMERPREVYHLRNVPAIPWLQRGDRVTVRETGVGSAKFKWSGLDDMTTGGTFTGASPLDYRVQVDGTGSPNTFKWSDDGGSTWDVSAVAMTGTAQTLNNGVTVTFAATTGHTLNNYWDFQTSLSSMINKESYILGIEWSFDGQQYNFSDLALMAVENLFPHDDYFRANADELGPTSAPLFY